MKIHSLIVNSTVLLVMGGMLISCTLNTPEIITETTPVILEDTSTPTIVWFPATATPTAFVTIQATPTPDQTAPYGSLLFEDDFNADFAWSTGNFQQGNIATGQGELNLAPALPGTELVSLRSGAVLGDFYLEMTLSPNLCFAADEYGVAFWSVAERNNFRMALNCQGEFRLVRVENSTVTPLQDWTPSAQIPRGGLNPVRIGLWSGGGEVRFYANGILQMDVYLPVKAGGLGVFSTTRSSPSMSVNFSDLQVYAVTVGDYPPTPTPTIQSTHTPYPTQPKP